MSSKDTTPTGSPAKETPADASTSKKPSKGPVIITFVLLILFIIGYVIYLFEAYKNDLFPFKTYGPPIDDTEAFTSFTGQDPSGAIRPLGPVESITGDTDAAATLAGLSVGYMCQWYAQPNTGDPNTTGYVPLPGDPTSSSSQIAQFTKACQANNDLVAV